MGKINEIVLVNCRCKGRWLDQVSLSLVCSRQPLVVGQVLRRWRHLTYVIVNVWHSAGIMAAIGASVSVRACVRVRVRVYVRVRVCLCLSVCSDKDHPTNGRT